MEKDVYIEIVEQITSSKSFGRSRTYANLLAYLVDCTLNKNVPKETTIASDIFGKTDFDPAQSTLVRVYVYNLRKKLENYYRNEGKEDKKLLKIPKGSYEVLLIDRKSESPKKEKVFPFKTVMASILLLLIISLFFNIRAFKNSDDTSKIATSKLWKDLLSQDQSLTVVIGDLFLYEELDSLSEAYKTTRNSRVNSLEEFEEFKLLNETSEVSFQPADYTFLIYNSALWIKDLSHIFAKSNKDFAVRNMARFNPKALQDGDFIVLGMIKTFGLFRDYTETTAFPYDPKRDGIVYTDSSHTQKLLKPFGDPNAYHTDYGIIMKIPGSNSNNIYLFGGIWDTGASQSLKYFTDENLLAKLEADMLTKFGSIPEYYEVLFEVKGIDRMELTPTILDINQKTPSSLFKN
ncbi:helix-turn-helix domain-containing protein [Seonamhaeicola marinus]|uniref:Winged helix-turn-helix domain-containing protein n=1 Tax=Seonamhaeicola marinus TaxID=1912246 RepID=A0A5D0HVS4_9FLAO|nr:helix-turn-helix domain-containing protein [Seonamhaeicola marinus]TYA74629.1 winged helix-turn-helix domain-containing protein [Seonamhaeicola marinus]